MAYETGVASDPADLVTKLCTFAAGNGWTQYTCTPGRALAKGNVVIGLNGDADSLDTRAATAVDTGAAWNAQTGNSGTTHVCDLGAGPYTAYHFYAITEDGKDLLAACIEISAGIYRHWVTCDLVKFGAWTGGTYTDSVEWNDGASYFDEPDSSYHRYIADTLHSNAAQTGHFRCDVDGASPNWATVRDYNDFTTPTGGIGVMRTQGKLDTPLSSIGYQRWNLRTPLWPLELFITRGSSLRSPVGRVPAMRAVNLRNHTPGEIVSIGGDNWQLWPVCARTNTPGDNTNTSSGYYGYAYKR